jgi:hypothetical protein
MTLSIVDFLNARLTEDETAAKAAGGQAWHQYDARHEHGRIQDEDGEVVTYDEGAPTEGQAAFIARHDPARVLREVAAKRALLAAASDLPEWKQATESWILDGPGLFAECWTDNTVNSWIFESPDGRLLGTSGVQSRDSREACQSFAENWILEHLPERSLILRHLAAIYSDHPDWREVWRPILDTHPS